MSSGILSGKRVLAVYSTCGIAFLSLLLVSALIPTTTTLAQVNNPSNVCQEIVTAAFERVNDYCGQLGRNNACYGNTSVKAEFSGQSALRFDPVGDKVPVRVLRSLSVSPLDLQNGLWGLSVLKLQANLPDTLPGQNVTFLVYGNTTVENAGDNMRSLYFTSGLGSQDCSEAPRDGITVRSPNHLEVTFTVNGVDITIGSTLVMRAERNKSMELHLVEGHGTIKTPYGSQAILPGEQVTVQLGGENGLQPISAPSKPVKVVDNNLKDVICLLDHLDGKMCEEEERPAYNTPVPMPSSNNSSPSNVSKPQKAKTAVPTVKAPKKTKTPYPPKPTKSKK